MIYDLSRVGCLTLISSESCNLNCKYCEIAKAISKEKHAAITCEISNSLKSGQYFKNILQIAERYNIDLNKIKELEFWGQEPTLTLLEVSQLFPIIYQSCPNIEETTFSTNMVDHIDNIIEYVKSIVNTVEKDKKFTIRIQFSYDGAEYTKKNRGIDGSIIKNNILSCIKQLNKLVLNNVKVRFVVHGVLSSEIINNLISDGNDAIINYWLETDNFIAECCKIIDNPNLYMLPHFGPSFAVPYNGSTEDGKNLAHFIRRTMNLNINTYDKQATPWEALLQQSGHFLELLRNVSDSYHQKMTINDVLYLLFNQEDHAVLKRFSSAMLCGFGIGDLKVRYDGTIIHCQNVVYGLTEDELIDKTGLRYDLQKALLKQKAYPNLLDDKDNEAVQKFLYKADIINKSSFLHYFSINLNLMTLLAGADQIDSSYKTDEEKMIRHAFIISLITPCYDNSLQTTASGLGRYAGWIRFLCNGYLDILDEELVFPYERNER